MHLPEWWPAILLVAVIGLPLVLLCLGEGGRRS